MAEMIVLRNVIDSDLPVFFEIQLDPEANRMAAFTSKNPSDRSLFDAHWEKIRSDRTIKMSTIVLFSENVIAGYVSSYPDQELGHLEVTYWIGRKHWGKGIATQALKEFLNRKQRVRPIYARVAKDNIASYRVLLKCNFKVVGEGKGFANARGREIEEFVLRLDEV